MHILHGAVHCSVIHGRQMWNGDMLTHISGVLSLQVAELKRRTQEQAGRLKEAEAAAEAARREAPRVRSYGSRISVLLKPDRICFGSAVIRRMRQNRMNAPADGPMHAVQAAEAKGQLEGELQAVQQQRASGAGRSAAAGSAGADAAAAQLSPRVPSPQEGGARYELWCLAVLSIYVSCSTSCTSIAW